jgi:hypothetical protein
MVMNKKFSWSQWAIPALTGVIIGLLVGMICLVYMAQERSTVLLANIASTRAAIPTRPFASNTPSQTATHHATSTATPAPTQEYNLDAVLTDAQDDLDMGDTEQIRETLLPLLEKVTDLKNLSRINAMIGDTYTADGFLSFANYYYEQAYTQQGTAENLYKLAITYGATGQSAKALEKFEALAAYPGSEADEYRSMAEQQLSYLRMYLGTSTPQP